MEEKERYELKIYAGCEYYSITDTKEKQQITIENTINLLNQQDKRIKELEEENKELNEYLETDEVTKREYYQKVDKNDKAKDREIKKLKDKIRELEDFTENTANLIDKLTEDSVFASTQLAIEQLELARRRIDRLGYNENKCLNKKDCIEDCLEEIDNQIKELKGEE